MSDDYICGFVDEIACLSGAKGDFWKVTVNGESYGLGKFPPKFGEGSEIEFDIRWNGNYPNIDFDTLNVINAVGSGPSGNGRGGNGGGRGGQSRGGQGQRQGGGGGSQGGGYRSQGGQNGGGSRPSQGGNRGNGDSRPQGGHRPAQGGGGRSAAGGGFSAGAGKDQYWADKEKRDIETQKAIQLQSSRNSAIALLGVLLSSGAATLPAAKGKAYDAALALVDELTEKFQNETNDLRGGGKSWGRAAQQGGDDTDGDDLPEYNENDE